MPSTEQNPSHSTMAFVVHTLPPPSRPSATRRPATCSTSGQISVSRRRRDYDFLLRTATTAAPVSESAETSPSNALNVSATQPTPSAEDRAAAFAAVAQRLAALEEAIRKDAESKRRQWLDEIAQFRTPRMPVSTYAPAVTPVQPPNDYKDYTTPTQTQSVAYSTSTPPMTAPSRTPVNYAAPAQTQPVAPPKPSTASTAGPSQTVTSTPSPAVSDTSATVSDLYAPPSAPDSPPSAPDSPPSAPDSPPSAPSSTSAGVERPSVRWFESVVNAAEAAVESASDMIENITDDLIEDAQEMIEKVVEDGDDSDDSFVEQMIEKVASEAGELLDGISQEDADREIAEANAAEAVAKAPEPTTDGEQKTIGKKLIDAIVEGVDTTDPAAPAVDRSDLVQLVESGKVKNLTVTKLRRLLSANGLKTSGRKAELIARLTSFANAK